MEITLQGTLKFFKLSELLNFLNIGQKTGTLNVSVGQKLADIYFDSGSVVYAVSNQEKYRLGSVMIRKKKIDEQVWKKLENLMLQQGEKFGKVAVEEQVITESELHDFLKIQVSEIIYDCFTWNHGKFTFVDVMQLPPHAVTISIDHANLIMEGARRITEIGYFAQNLPQKTSVLRTIGDPSNQEKINLTLEEWKILFLIDGKRTLDDVSNECSENLLDVYRLLYGLFANKLVEVIPEEELIVHEMREESRRPVAVSPTSKFKQDTRLLISTTAGLTYKDVLKVTLARLTLKKADNDKKTFPLIEQEYYIGRQLGNQIHISDPSISNVHARIFKGPEGYVLEDLNSRNGTFVNGARIDRKLLHENDAVRLGNSNFIYNIMYEVKKVPNAATS
jgi:pSer/pThr/pTyr-binding forkhead associated (FHA) protein